MPMKQNRTIPMDENHRRAISTRLRLLDELLCEFEEYARGREIRSVFYQELNSISASQRRLVLADIERMRSLMREMKATLGLEPGVENVGRLIWGKSSAFWQVLIETTSKHLKGYGELSPELARYLDPRMEVLIKHLGMVTRHVGSRPTDKGSADGAGEQPDTLEEDADDGTQEPHEA